MEDAAQSRVFIVDDHPVVREGIVQVLNREEDFTVIGEAGGTREALEFIKTHPPDVVLLDISLENEDGLEFLHTLHAQYPGLKVVVVTMHDESLYIKRAFKAGAKGYFLKRESIRHLPAALRSILSGHIYMTDGLSTKMVESLLAPDEDAEPDPELLLTGRELEILQLIGEGWRRQSIADRLFVSVKTIGTYYERLKQKLHLDTTADLTHFAIRWMKRKE
ncbi:MAG TPA: response regulator transcription factor [bacterium]|nr:response regulator transcription factor [bacterium]